jgi:hypothetical protein
MYILTGWTIGGRRKRSVEARHEEDTGEATKIVERK